MDYYLVALHDATDDVLCFVMQHLSLLASQNLRKCLRAELLSNPSAALDDLPYLEALVRRASNSVALPGGTNVSCQPYTLHRLDVGASSDAEVFVPERWLGP
ncbi:hypothetical protein VTO73DRAFT_15297 [Trametes versicolor]